MNWLVCHIVSGHAFFTGIALIILAVVMSTQSRPVFKRIAVLSFLVGLVAIAISSTAIPYWYYAIAAAATVAWIVSRYPTPWRRWAPFVVCGVWLIAALIELPYHITPSLVPTSARSVTVIGDSLTAGVGGGETSDTWPSILAREHQLRVQDISHVGETAASAFKRAETHEIRSPVVLVEIGGNDLLGSTTAAQFARDLDALLGHLAATDRQVIMFELPLPPFCHEYGRVQRSLAAKHNVALVPKHVLLSVLADRNSTLDTIHLTQLGHQRMADSVWRLIQSAFESNSIAMGESPFEITSVGNVPQGFSRVFSKRVDVFGIPVFATRDTPDQKVLHAANVLAQYLDNDSDGEADNKRVLQALRKSKGAVVMFSTERDAEAVLRDVHRYIPEEVWDTMYTMGLYGEEVHAGGAARGVFDATYEEVLHLITAAGYAKAYPHVFGEKPGTEIANAMDKARGGHFQTVPHAYPDGAWYTYDDRSCDYGCQITEYIYWGLTSILGAQDFPGRREEISGEWKLNTAAKVKAGDPALYTLLTDPKYAVPTQLPDGKYTPQQ